MQQKSLYQKTRYDSIDKENKTVNTTLNFGNNNTMNDTMTTRREI